jgi:2-keto-3-deoxy-L-rhamnonate aldolase RhmA
MNKLTVDEFIKNRDEYLENGRSAGGNTAQQNARAAALANKYEELLSAGIPPPDARSQANAWIKTQAALHDPDQIAGGDPTKVIGVGNARINSSIGSQWKTRIDDLDGQIRDIAKNMTDTQKQNTYLNVRLIQ